MRSNYSFNKFYSSYLTYGLTARFAAIYVHSINFGELTHINLKKYCLIHLFCGELCVEIARQPGLNKIGFSSA